MNDLQFAIRQLLKYPGFTAVAVLTLVLGVAGPGSGLSTIRESDCSGFFPRPAHCVAGGPPRAGRLSRGLSGRCPRARSCVVVSGASRGKDKSGRSAAVRTKNELTLGHRPKTGNSI